MSELRSLLMTEMSRRNTDFVKDIALSNPPLFDELVKLSLLNEEPVSRRAMWVVDVASEEMPDLLLPHIPDLIASLESFKHDGLKRHVLRMLNRYNLNLDEFMPILDLCFHYMSSGDESVAVRFQAMDLLHSMSEKEPALKHELISTIELQMQEGSPGIKNQSRKKLKLLKKEINQSKS
jgi:hypothetical protein